MGTCAECDEPIYATALCRYHYMAAWRSENREKTRLHNRRGRARAKVKREAARPVWWPYRGLWCEVWDCFWPAEPGRRLCPAHRHRLKKRGDVRADIPVKRHAEPAMPAPIQALWDQWMAEWREDPHSFVDFIEQVEKNRERMRSRYK